MSSLLVNFAARCPPRTVAFASGSAARATRARSVRSLSYLAFPPHGVTGTSASSLTSARRLRTARPSFALQQRFMYMEAKTSPAPQDTTYGGGVEGLAQAATEPSGGKPAAPQALNFYEALVSGIPFNMMESDFQAYLEDAGVRPTKIVLPMRPSTSNRIGQNKGRAFVAFDTEEDLQKLLALHNVTLNDRFVSVRRLAVPVAEATCVIIRTMRGITEGVLMEVLERELGAAPKYMNVTENPERNTCTAWVALESHEQAVKATALDGANIVGRWLDVGLSPGVVKEDNSAEEVDDIPRNQPFKDPPTEGKIVMVRGLPFDLHERELLAFFEQYGVPKEAILQVRIPKHNSRGRNTGLAYINTTDRGADLVINLHGSYIHDRWINISLWEDRGSGGTPSVTGLENGRIATPARLREKYPDLPCLELTNIPFDKTQQELMDFLKENGVDESTISEVAMPKYRQTANNIGLAWVVMNDEAATNRMMELTGSTFHDRWITIEEAPYPLPQA